MWIDTHCHLSDAQYDADRPEVIQRALAAHVTTLIEIAESPDMWETAVRFAESQPFVYASLGIHPHHAHEVGPQEWPTLCQKLRVLLQHPKVVALGEFGLDYVRMQNTKEQQVYLFDQQLHLAKEVGKPVVIHCREAHADVQTMLTEFYPERVPSVDCPQPVGVIHCFSGAWSDAQTYLMQGFMVGIDGPVTYPSAHLLKQNVTRLPLQRMVLETDSPYLPPQTHRGQRNEPSHIPAIAEAIGLLKKINTDDISKKTTENARRLFRLP